MSGLSRFRALSNARKFRDSVCYLYEPGPATSFPRKGVCGPDTDSIRGHSPSE